MSGAANASATDVRELKYGLSASSAVAAGAGLTFKDTATALAVFAQNGLKGSDAGTSLKTMLMRLNPSTKEAYNKMRDLGLITYNEQHAGFDFLVKKRYSTSFHKCRGYRSSFRKYVMKTEGVTKWNDKCDYNIPRISNQFRFFYLQNSMISKDMLQGLDKISGLLNESMKDLTDQQRSMALETLFWF